MGVIVVVFCKNDPHNNESLLQEGNHGGVIMAKSKVYKRDYYLSQLRPFYDADDLIKVVTGIRRCGKSYLLLSVMDELRARGVPENNIAYLNLDRSEYRKVTTPDLLEQTVYEALSSAGPGLRYLFVDEVQNVRDFEPVINAVREDGDTSVFLTGSNSYLLSGDLVTKLTGRYVETEMFTLSFAEWLGMRRFLGLSTDNTATLFREYLSQGGFPRAVSITDPRARAMYIRDVVSQIFEKDVRTRRKIKDVALFDRVQAYFVNNFAAPTNLANVIDYLDHTEHVRIKRETLSKYLRSLEDAKILYRCPRFDLKSKRMLRGGDKFYLADTGIYTARNTDARISYGPALENVLYTHLRAKGYQVSVGRIGRLECDFIAQRDNMYWYIQVSMSVMDPSVEEREYRPFRDIRDYYPRYLFTLDPLPEQRDGIRHVNLMEFLSSDGELLP